jgi:glycine cleavage system H protein
VVFVQLPEVGSEVENGESFAEVESTKSVSDIFGPLNGTIAAVNEELESTPDLVNSEPYDSGWLVEISVDDAGALDAQLADLLDADGYRQVIEG